MHQAMRYWYTKSNSKSSHITRQTPSHTNRQSSRVYMLKLSTKCQVYHIHYNSLIYYERAGIYKLQKHPNIPMMGKYLLREKWRQLIGVPEIVQMTFSIFGYSVTSIHTNTKSRCPILQAEDVHATDLMKYSYVLDSLTGNGISCLADRSCKSCQLQYLIDVKT